MRTTTNNWYYDNIDVDQWANRPNWYTVDNFAAFVGREQEAARRRAAELAR